MTNVVRSVRRYSISFQRQIVQEIEKGDSILMIKRRYGIGGATTIQRWIRKFGKPQIQNQIIRIETMDEKDRIKKLEEENKKLKLALADAVMAKTILETVIDEANREYHTDLKKNFGDKESPATGKPTR